MNAGRGRVCVWVGAFACACSLCKRENEVMNEEMLQYAGIQPTK